jgi:hypothetical protein
MAHGQECLSLRGQPEHRDLEKVQGPGCLPIPCIVSRAMVLEDSPVKIQGGLTGSGKLAGMTKSQTFRRLPSGGRPPVLQEEVQGIASPVPRHCQIEIVHGPHANIVVIGRGQSQALESQHRDVPLLESRRYSGCPLE